MVAIKTILNLLEKQDKRIKELESDNNECNNRISDYIETINKIREEFLKYDWKNSNNEQIYNQLKSLYNEIFENKAKVNLQSNEKNVDTQDFKQKYQCKWNLKSNKESGDENVSRSN